jgi:hypothetical protein
MLVCNIAENIREPGEKTEFCFGRNVLYTNRVEGITNSLHPTKQNERLWRVYLQAVVIV